MSRFSLKRLPSPAMAVAFVALLAALSGTAIALPGKNTVDSGDIKKGAVKPSDLAKNAVRGNKVKNNSLTGSDVKGLGGGDVNDDSLTGADVNEGSLGKVPSAANADSAGSAGALTSLRVFSRSLNEGQEANIFSHGPLSAVARCADVAGATQLSVIVATTEDGTAYGGDDNSEGSIGPATPEGDRIPEDPGVSDAAAGTPSHSDGYDDQFSMIAPSGAAVNATVSSTANADTGVCRFYGHVQIVG